MTSELRALFIGPVTIQDHKVLTANCQGYVGLADHCTWRERLLEGIPLDVAQTPPSIGYQNHLQISAGACICGKVLYKWNSPRNLFISCVSNERLFEG